MGENFSEFGTDIEKDRRFIEALSGGRQVIVKFKKGGRIDQDRTYDSAADDHNGIVV